jgi:UDP-N-acetylglucosamine--N-acetylmuramyl-(pentapeptide) pyrophosphoryl-undecaprenol N-acetylglucosamine transferase
MTSRTQHRSERRSAVLFVCDAGGHLMEAVEVARAHFADREQRWHTADTPMSRSLLAGRDVTYSTRRVVPARADLAAREVAVALRHLRGSDIGTVVSTGSAYALPWLLAARLLRREARFVESAARMTSQSRVGSLVAKVPGVRLATQEPLELPGWEPWPNVVSTALDAAVQTRRTGDGEPRVVVTVGTFEFPFDRLIHRADAVIPASWSVTVQHGVSARPARGTASASMPYDELNEAMAKADVVVGHAGVGTVLSALATGAQLVVVPRRGSRGEHVDDHQLELVEFLRGHDGITALADVDDLTVEVLNEHVRRAREPANG